MGVKDFMTIVRPSIRATNTSLKVLIEDHPEKDCIGVFMSILLIQAIKSCQSIITQLFTDPEVPINELNEKVCDKLEVYVKAGFTIFCVFDGLPGKLKKDHAYLSRYGKNEEKKTELEELYKVKSFTSTAEEEINISKVKALRKHLATFNRPDLLFELKQ